MSLIISIKTEMTGLDNLVKAAGPSADVAFARALNHTGAVVRTRYLREVRQILGIRKHRFAKAGAVEAMNKRTSTRKASAGRLEYSLAGFGRGLDLLYYQARETAQGLRVVWLGEQRVIPQTFYHGGRFPRRKGGFGPKRGISAERTGRSLRFSPRGSGLPEGMVAPKPAGVWESEAQARLAPRLAHELTAILMGFAPAGSGR